MNTSYISGKLFAPARLGRHTLRNRIIRAGCFEGMSRDGMVSAELIEHHRRIAQGGVAMTTVAYFAVSDDGRTFRDQLAARPQVEHGLRELAWAVHKQGALASIQLVHAGFFADPKVIGGKPLGASPKYCAYHLTGCTEMTAAQIEEKVRAFADAAAMVKKAGFDAVEVHAGHGYLLSQFMSPWTNRRTDGYGGAIDNRMRFPAAVVTAVRQAAGSDMTVLVKMNVSDGFKAGLTPDDAVAAARQFEKAGAHCLVTSGGFTARTPFYMLRGRLPVREMAANQAHPAARLGLLLFGGLMVPRHRFTPMFFLEQARVIKDAVKIPVAYVGGAVSLESMNRTVGEGFGFIQLGRATIRDPDIVTKMQGGGTVESDCDHCNRCVAAMDKGGVVCVSQKKGLLR